MTQVTLSSSAEPGSPEQENSEPEPSRTCAELSIEDERWESIRGLQTLIPALVADTLASAGGSESRCVSIALLSDSAVRALNKAFRGKDSATNVLSFPAAPSPPAFDPRSGPVFLGDVALAYETVVQEAAAQQKTVVNHCAHLIVHGVLHLAGFDHERDEDAERMEGTERAILARFGISDPYAEDAAFETTV